MARHFTNGMNSLGLVLAVCLGAAMTGCQAIDFYVSPLENAAADRDVPRELSKVSLPTYRIEPPDVLSIEVLSLVPRPPYRIELYDVLQIRVLGTMLDQPIDGYYLVEGEGVVSLGPAYGSVRVAGMTIDEAVAETTRQLEQILQRPEVSILLARSAGVQQLSGAYLVQPDGTSNLREYGMVRVAGKTLAETQSALERQLGLYFDSPRIGVDIAGYNSKLFYIITVQNEMGDNIQRFPVTGNETVLDALGGMERMSALSSKTMWLARPAPGGAGCEQIMPIDWAGISRGGLTATNYQILPGDRLYIVDDKLVAADNYLAQFTQPISRLLSLGSLGANTIRGAQVLGRSYNRTRRY